MIVLESSIITAIMNISYHYHCCHSCCCIIYLTLILNFFHLLSKWALLGIFTAQNIHQLPVIEMRSIFDLMGFHKARKDKMQRQGKKKS